MDVKKYIIFGGMSFIFFTVNNFFLQRFYYEKLLTGIENIININSKPLEYDTDIKNNLSNLQTNILKMRSDITRGFSLITNQNILLDKIDSFIEKLYEEDQEDYAKELEDLVAEYIVADK
jgi:hypothetical protein